MELEDGSDGYVDVPLQDLRALRRAVLDLDEFFKTTDTSPERVPV
jgi:hypothetical protein